MPHGKIASCRDDSGGHKPLNSAAAKMLRVSCNPLGEGSRCKCFKFVVIAKPVRRLVVAISRNNVYFEIPTPVCALARNDKERLLKTSANVGTPCCRTGFCVRRNKEPICDSQIRWVRSSVLSIRRVDCCCSPKKNNFLCPRTRPIIRTQKRPHFAPRGKMQAFLMLTFSD